MIGEEVSVELARLSSIEAREAFQQARVGLVPVGSIEQHGPHLPLGTDWYIASHISGEAARSEERLLVPGLQVGVSREHRQFWGTLTVSPNALRDQAVCLARSLASHGLRRTVFVNGHGSNCGPLDDAARDLREEGIFAFVFNWWQSIASILRTLFPDPTAHAGSIETSLMLAIEPELVRIEQFAEAGSVAQWGTYVEGVLVGFDAADFTERGNVGDPKLADADKGRRVLSAACESLNRFCGWLASQNSEDLESRPHLP